MQNNNMVAVQNIFQLAFCLNRNS